MNKKLFLLISIFIFSSILTACGADPPLTIIPEDAQPGDLIWRSCKDYRIKQTDYPVDCVTLVVSEKSRHPYLQIDFVSLSFI